MEFVKMVASGNDFVVCELNDIDEESVVKICDYKWGIGADGVLLVNRVAEREVSMRIFNSDGSEAEMCGNGARCVVRYCWDRWQMREVEINTVAGKILGWYFPEKMRSRVQLTKPSDISLDINLDILGQNLLLHYLNTGVPHVVVFVDDIERVDVQHIGSEIRYHSFFSPKGTNVDFIEVLDENSIRIRTYERGVEAETLSCGTGSVAGAVVSVLKGYCKEGQVFVAARSGEVLTVGIKKDGLNIDEVWIEANVKLVFEGRTIEL